MINGSRRGFPADLVVRERGEVLHLDVPARQGGVEQVVSRIVDPVFLRNGPTADRGDALLDVTGGHLRNRQIIDYGVDVRVEARPPYLPRFRTAP